MTLIILNITIDINVELSTRRKYDHTCFGLWTFGVGKTKDRIRESEIWK